MQTGVPRTGVRCRLRRARPQEPASCPAQGEHFLDQGVRGFDPEPRAGYRLASVRDRELEAFSRACWQRIEGHHDLHHGVMQWPGAGTFHANWPLLAVDLIVGAWKIAGAAAADFPLVEETDLDLLDPPPPVEVDWHDSYAAELAAHPAIAADLTPRPEGSPGDGIERVLERAHLKPAERRVMRAWLYTPDLAQIAEDLGERPHTVVTLLKHAANRLEWLGRPKDAWRYASVNTPERFGWVQGSSPQAAPEAELAQEPANDAILGPVSHARGVSGGEGFEVIDTAGAAEEARGQAAASHAFLRLRET